MTPPKKTQDFHPTKRLRDEYAAGIRAVTGRMLKPRMPEQSLDDWLRSLQAASQERDIQEASEVLASRFVAQVDAGNKRTWRDAAAKAMRSAKLTAALKNELQDRVGQTFNRLVQENAKYIRSVATESAERLVHEVKQAELNGARPATIAKMMRSRFPQLLRSRTQLIARTESAKVSSALTQARAEEIGLAWYVWQTSEDVRVRVSHKKMDDVLVSWHDPPDPEALVDEKSSLGHYNVGNCPNCRCTALVILDIDDVTWPHRVHWHGSIKQMTKTAFLRIAGLQKAA